jgi:hypothetical protein
MIDLLDRRSFMVGAVSVVIATKLPPINLISYRSDINDVIDLCHNDFLKAKVCGDWMYIFHTHLEKKMKEWGTYQPLKEIVWGNGEHKGKGCGIWTDPNFFDSCHFMGVVEFEGHRYDTSGFTTSFQLPTKTVISARYHWDGKKFDMKEIVNDESTEKNL